MIRSQTALHVGMYILGDKYDIPDLKDFAKSKVALAFGDQTAPREDFLNVITLVYECTPETDRNLRDLVVLSARARMVDIIKDKTLKDRLAEVVRSTPDFSMDMLESFTTTPLLADCLSSGSHKRTKRMHQF